MTATRTPWLARQSRPESPATACMQAAGTVLTGFPAASTAPLERTQASGWLDRPPAVNMKVAVEICAEMRNPMSETELSVVIVRLGGNRCGRIHSGMATWRAAKMARVTAMAGTARRMDPGGDAEG